MKIHSHINVYDPVSRTKSASARVCNGRSWHFLQDVVSAPGTGLAAVRVILDGGGGRETWLEVLDIHPPGLVCFWNGGNELEGNNQSEGFLGVIPSQEVVGFTGTSQ